MKYDLMTSWPYLILGYIFGSIAFGLLLTRLAGAGDLRSIGSGNIGATNVLRTGRKGLAASTLLLDLLKGMVAVWVAQYIASITLYGNILDAGIAAAFGAFLGHLYPIWLRFNGGKGVATYAGIALGLCWPVGLLFALIWIATLLILRISSMAGLLASVSAPLAALYLGGAKIALALALCTGLIIWRHRENISRLMKGQEPKVGNKKDVDE